MNTIFEKGSKQLEYFPNQLETIDYQKNAEPGDIIKVDRVLQHGKEFGQPYLEGIIVSLEVIRKGSEKVAIVKKKAKKRYKVTRGFRTPFT